MKVETQEVSLEQAAEQFFLDRRCRGLRPGSLAWYKEKLGGFLCWFSNTYPGTACQDLTSGLLRKFVEVEQRRGRSAGGINGHLRAVKSFTRFLAEEGTIEAAPKVKFLREDKPLPKTLSDGAMRRMIEKAGSLKTFSGQRDRAAMLLLLETGLRASELCRLRVKDLDLQGFSLVISRKTRQEQRLFFGHTTARGLLGYKKRRERMKPCGAEDPLFVTEQGRELTPRRLYHALAEYGRRCKIPGSVSAHCWRRSCATRLHQQGESVFTIQRLLGHASPTTTAKYVGLTDDDMLAMQARSSLAERVMARR
jgi:integrase/recombinase XerD